MFYSDRYAVPADKNTSLETFEKLGKLDIGIEINRAWHLKTIALSVAIGDLRMMPKEAKKYGDEITGSHR